MTSAHPFDVSLYELAVNSEQSPHPLQLSPTTFKSVVALFLDFLVDQNLPATIWVKLPRGEVWQAEVDRFCQLATAPYVIYNLQTYQKPELAQSAASIPKPDISQPSTATSQWEGTRLQSTGITEIQDFSFEDITLDDLPLPEQPRVPVDQSKIHLLPLSADSQLKREYFLLIAAPSFYGLVLAHRPRSVRTLTEGGKLSSIAEDTLERKHPL
ncbi:MAG TPA: DICT sensory domain-containing protein, partial [Allocoleopsis sp.]